ncbi:SGNH/GDSL hydrolase family protein [Lapidilactobacillus mulanensis]|uniref:SGNH/GDSL hydrolase family protein n=1 Tax=Lapidilactobacillus mulanensis TaxID=2485999 RepID=A0ABW4DSS0_9LACO|nr:SGNH/GDSL hydrolase family protein [Lapidilactobacillus mulanensis]
MLLRKNKKLIFIGDSVTDAGRNYSADMAGYDSWGNGYVNLINGALTATYPDYQTMVINKGVNGNDILKLATRWQQDVLDLKPDYVSILIGVNDAWRHFDTAVFQQRDDLVDVALYTRTYQKLINQTRSVTDKIIVVGPFMFEPNRTEPMRAMVDQFAVVARQLADKNELLYIDVQSKIDRFLTQNSSYILTQDRVHPNFQGNMLVATTWLNAIDFDWKRGE